jgi:hypothetical protein
MEKLLAYLQELLKEGEKMLETGRFELCDVWNNNTHDVLERLDQNRAIEFWSVQPEEQPSELIAARTGMAMPSREAAWLQVRLESVRRTIRMAEAGILEAHPAAPPPGRKGRPPRAPVNVQVTQIAQLSSQLFASVPFEEREEAGAVVEEIQGALEKRDTARAGRWLQTLAEKWPDLVLKLLELLKGTPA